MCEVPPKDWGEIMLTALMVFVCCVNLALGWQWAMQACAFGALFHFTMAMGAAVVNPLVWGKW